MSTITHLLPNWSYLLLQSPHRWRFLFCADWSRECQEAYCVVITLSWHWKTGARIGELDCLHFWKYAYTLHHVVQISMNFLILIQSKTTHLKHKYKWLISWVEKTITLEWLLLIFAGKQRSWITEVQPWLESSCSAGQHTGFTGQ